MEPQSGQLALSAEATERLEPKSPSRLRVLVDGRKIGDGGIGTYIDNLVTGLLGLPHIQVAVVASKEKRRLVAWGDAVPFIYSDLSPYSWKEYTAFRHVADWTKFDLLHVPHYTLPFGIPIPSVVTIHDVIHISHPEKWYYPLIAKPLVKSAIRRASVVVAVSRATQSMLQRSLHLSPRLTSKIVVCPNAAAVPSVEAIPSKRAQEYAPYFLAVLSNLKPHKGLADLLEAYRLLRITRREEKTGRTPSLVILGLGAEALSSDPKLLTAVGSIPGIFVEGKVSREELYGWYRGALALVVPSKEEGFCLPVIEAQSVGTPVVTRPVPAVSELLTSTDVTAANMSVDALAEAFEAAIDRVPRNGHRRVDVEHLGRYDVAKVAGQVAEIYSSVVRQRRIYP